MKRKFIQFGYQVNQKQKAKNHLASELNSLKTRKNHDIPHFEGYDEDGVHFVLDQHALGYSMLDILFH
jgi:hypothetical protein